MSETVTRKRHAKRQAILDVAVSLFAERGYHSTRMADIAQELGLQKAALYYYFDSKEAVLVELIRSRVGLALDALTEITAGDLDVTAKLEAAVHAHLRVFHQHGDIYRIFSSEKLHAISGEAARIVDDLGRRYEQLWAEMISDGVTEGSVRPGIDVGVAVKGILGMLNTTLAWYDPSGRLTVEDLAAEYSALVRGALAG